MSRRLLIRYCLAVLPWAILLQLFVGIPLHETTHFIVALLVGGDPVFTAWHRVTVSPGLPAWAYVLIGLSGPVTSILFGWLLFTWGKKVYFSEFDKNVSVLEGKFRKFLLVVIIVTGVTTMFTGVWNLIPLPGSDGNTILRALLQE